MCGRTLFGAKPPKGTGAGRSLLMAPLRPRVDGLYGRTWTKSSGSSASIAKTEHNEVAPSQHEMAPVYCDCQHQPADQNQLTMEIMKKVADRHGSRLPAA